MKKLLLVGLFVFWGVLLAAKPARPGFISALQPDGSTILIRRHGDEWGHWTTNAAGEIVRRDADGFYRVLSGLTPSAATKAAASARLTRRRVQASARTKSPVAVGKKHFLVVLVEFQDLDFKLESPRQEISDMLNQVGYSKNGATGSARDYYFDNSHGGFEPVFDVFGPVRLDNDKAYYGGNDERGDDRRPEQALRDACRKLDPQVNFSDYDLDGDGDVDMVYMVYAGFGEADSDDEDAIWPHQWFLYSGGGINLRLDGKRVDRYACGPELNGDAKQDGIGTICHEFGHAIGLPDFYDPDDDENGTCRTLLHYSLMDAGSYNNDGWTPPYLNVVERIMLGWLDESALQTFPVNGTYTLEPVQSDKAYKTPTDVDGEYFVYECRSADGWDRYVLSPGLLVYHVDQSERGVSILDVDGNPAEIPASTLWKDWRIYNSINENGEHPCFYLVASGGPEDVMYGMRYFEEYSGYAFDYASFWNKLTFPGVLGRRTFRAKSWSGTPSEVSLSGISYRDGKAEFTVSGVSPRLSYPCIANPGKGRYKAGSAFSLSLELPKGYEAVSVSWRVDGVSVPGASVTLGAGSHRIEATVNRGSGKKDVVLLEIRAD